MNIEPYTLPLARPLETAEGRIDERSGFLLTVEVDGVQGMGEAAPLPGWTESYSTCRTTLEEAAEATGERLDAVLETIDPDATPAARHGLSLATADARSRANGDPLSVHLGTVHHDRVPVNATLGDGNVVQSRAAAERAVEDGFRTLKVKVGARQVESDLERLWAIREACPQVELRSDANGTWELETARKAIRAGSIQRLTYIEQPLPPDDLEGHATLRESGVGIALDESVARHGLDTVLAVGAADAIVLKPMAMGGPDIAVAAAKRARAAGVTPVVTTTVEGALARAAAVHVAAVIPDVPACGLATGDRLARDLLQTDPVPVDGGSVAVPQSPGTVPDQPDPGNHHA